MRAQLLLLLFFMSCAVATNRKILIRVNADVQNPDNAKSALKRAYTKHIATGHLKRNDEATIVLDQTVVLDWTSVRDESTILAAIDNLALTTQGNQGVCSVVDYVSYLAPIPEGTNEVYVIIDNYKHEPGVQDLKQVADDLQKTIKIYPVGVGHCVRIADLKKMAGPCNPLFGCHAPFSYFVAQSYNSIKRSVDVAVERTHELASNTLTTGEIVVAVLVSVLISVLVLWCLAYACCRLPKEMPVYASKKTDMRHAIPRI